jgi:putative photosynthetic complex assembly protein 2
MTEHGVTVLLTILLWWFSTGVIFVLCGLPRVTHRWSMMAASLGLVAAAYGVAVTAWDTTASGAYLAFACALGVWGWIEMSFLFGYVTGPRVDSCPDDAEGWRRFSLASQTLLYHELTIVAGAVLVAGLSWGAPNQTGTLAFLILMLMRISAKLNIFLGVPNLTDEFLPSHLAYLKSYFRKRPFNRLFPISVALGSLLAAWLFQRAWHANPGSGESIGAVLLFALTALAILEHFFMMMPLRDALLWRWAMPRARTVPPDES